jgi:predicted small secreted protein
MKRIRFAATAFALIACSLFLAGCPKSMKTMQNQDTSRPVTESIG